MSAPPRLCAVCNRKLVFTERTQSYRCAHCQRHDKTRKKPAKPVDPLPHWDNVT